MTFHTGMKFLNVPAVAQAAEATAGFRNRNRAAQQGFRTRQTLAEALPTALAGDADARQAAQQRVAQTGDTRALSDFQAILAKATKEEQEAVKADQLEKAKFLFAVVKEQDPARKAEIYEMGRAFLKGRGGDVSQWPERYGPELDQPLKMQLEGSLSMAQISDELLKTAKDQRGTLRSTLTGDPVFDQGRVAAEAPADAGLTQTQRSNDREIDTARRLWQQIVDRDFSGDGRATINQMFALDPLSGILVPRDKAMADLWTQARQRKTGRDPDHETFIRQFIPQQAPPPAVADPASSNAEPGLFQRGFNALFGDDTGTAAPPPPGTPGATLPAPQLRGPNAPVGQPPPPGPGRPVAAPPPPQVSQPAATPRAGPRGRAPQRQAGKPVSQMSLPEIDSLLNGPNAGNLSPAELSEIDARLKALGR